MSPSALFFSFFLAAYSILTVSAQAVDVVPFYSYANDFVDPNYIVAGDFPNTVGGAKATILNWAEKLNAEGPWSVTDKPMLAPSGNKNDYMSWAPYRWPNCTGVGNTTALTPEQIWVTCPYVNRDGQFNPDRLTIKNVLDFSDFSDAVLYNALAFSFQNETSSVYSKNIVKFVNAWFLDNSTGMNPNLNYAQMWRGPDGQVGERTGVLDLKGFVKIVSGILILRKRKSVDWTPEIDSQLVSWSKKYMEWLETNKLGIEECASTNNHGSFCFNQLIALKLLVNDIPGAIRAGNTYFQGIYQNQINSTGDQPLEAARTRPYHYRNYNLGAMITNARLLKYLDPSSDPWKMKTKNGATIQDALDMTMTVHAADSGEEDLVGEIYPNIAAVASIYGDPDGKYAAFLQSNFPVYASDADFLWNQPLAGGTPEKVGGRTGSSGAVGHRGGGITIGALLGASMVSLLL
ncbi:chondroitin AC/alginate lyase [Mycena rebaudengoi]|nr:chondroitin AC/alginate lyase [Mycena rebaudengoi]